MTSPYIWLRKKDIDTVKLGIKNTKMSLKFDVILFRHYWSDRHYYKKDFLKSLIKAMRAHKLIISSLYKEIPVPLRTEKDMNIIRGNFLFCTDLICPTCGKFYYNDDGMPIRCPDCGQALWWNDQLNDTLDRYENGIYDGIHRRLIQR